MAHAKDDALNRALTEAKVEARRLVEATEAFWPKIPTC